MFKADGLLNYCVPEKGEYAFKFYLGNRNQNIGSHRYDVDG